MITVKFSCNPDGTIRALSVSGHAGYDVHGKDIICASSSTLFQTAAHALETLCGLKGFYKISEDEENNHSIIDLPIRPDLMMKDSPAQWIMATVRSGFELLEQTDRTDYGGRHIRIVYK